MTLSVYNSYLKFEIHAFVFLACLVHGCARSPSPEHQWCFAMQINLKEVFHRKDWKRDQATTGALSRMLFEIFINVFLAFPQLFFFFLQRKWLLKQILLVFTAHIFLWFVSPTRGKVLPTQPGISAQWYFLPKHHGKKLLPANSLQGKA